MLYKARSNLCNSIYFHLMDFLHAGSTVCKLESNLKQPVTVFVLNCSRFCIYLVMSIFCQINEYCHNKIVLRRCRTLSQIWYGLCLTCHRECAVPECAKILADQVGASAVNGPHLWAVLSYSDSSLLIISLVPCCNYYFSCYKYTEHLNSQLTKSGIV